VSIAGQDLKLPNPFMAFATQNPLNIEGTVPLPKVLADRFMVKIDVGYPSMEQEAEMLRIKESEIALDVKKVIDTNAIMQMQNDAKSIMMPDDVVQYITKIVDATRNDIHVVMGASPRADIAFMQCGKAKSLIEGRKEVTISDIKFLAKPVLSHRIAVRATGCIGVKGIIDGIGATLQ
jgi:MoxR-like ATPase